MLYHFEKQKSVWLPFYYKNKNKNTIKLKTKCICSITIKKYLKSIFLLALIFFYIALFKYKVN